MRDRQSVRTRRVSLLLALVALGGYALHFSWFGHQLNDDAFITFRYSRMLAEGHGPYFNHGEHVEGYTNFLLMLMIAGVIGALGPEAALPAAKLIGFVGGVGAILCTRALCRAWLLKIHSLQPIAGLLSWAAAGLLAGNSAFAVNSTSGLETTLFAFWITLGLWLVQLARDRKRWCGAGLAFALAALTRPEGAWVFAAVVTARLISADWADRPRRRALATDIAIVLLAAGGHLLWRYRTYDGELLPNTYYAKLGGFLGGGTAAAYTWNFARFHLGGPLVLLGVLPLLAHKRSLRRAVLPALLAVADGVLGVFLAGPDWMPGFRLLVPYAPAAAALCVTGAAVMCDLLLVRPRWAAAAVSALLPLGLLWWQSGVRAHLYEYVSTRAVGYVNGHMALADWLRSSARPGDTIALMDIGIVGFVCIEQRILDITGLTDRTIARAPGGFLSKQVDPQYVFGCRPEFFVAVLHAPLDDGELDVRKLKHWTELEQRLLNSPQFMREYFRARPPDPQADPLEQLAARLGAARVFLHEHPGLFYILAVYTPAARRTQP